MKLLALSCLVGLAPVVLAQDCNVTTTLESVSTAGQRGDDWSFAPSLSADGVWMVLHSEASDLVAGDTNSTGDIFVGGLVAGTTELASVSSAGLPGNHDSDDPSISWFGPCGSGINLIQAVLVSPSP